MSTLAADIAVRASGLSKKYRIGHAVSQDEALTATIGRAVLSPLRNLRHLRSIGRFDEGENDPDIIWALRDVSFEVRQGEVMGIVGRNGAGKSTLLKVLCRITEPTAGSAELRGRVSSLLEVGTGFHPDLTGRENVFLNGTMLGMTRREVAARFDEIVAFAEVERFVDTPVKRFSSGMYVRLAFSVAAHLEPDVLIADEVLAVGDAAFQRKCIGQMQTVARGGRAVLFVSHNLAVVGSLCDRAIWLESGTLRAEGDVEHVLAAYARGLDEAHTDVAQRSDRLGSGRVRVTSLALRDPSGAPLPAVDTGAPVVIDLRYAVDGPAVSGLVATVTIETLLREPVTTLSNALTGETLSASGDGALLCSLGGLPLNEGDYMCTVRLEADGVTADWIADVIRFRVDPGDLFRTRAHASVKSGLVLLPHSWSVRT